MVNSRESLAKIPSINHDGNPYIMDLDIYKEGYWAYDISNYYKGRVDDNGTPFMVRWFEHGQLKNVQGLRPFIRGTVGQHTVDDQTDPDNPKVVPSPDCSQIDQTGETTDTAPGGIAIYRMVNACFTQEGMFYGEIGLKDSSGLVLSSVDIAFKVLGGRMNMIGARKFYVSEFEKALVNLNEIIEKTKKDFSQELSNLINDSNSKVSNLITDARNAYNSQVANSRDAMNALDAEVKANRAELTNINDHLAGVEQQIAIHDIVTIPQHQEDIKNISNAIDERLAHMKTAPTAVENAATLQQRYPNGADGIFITADTGHKWLYLDGNWVDCGQYQAIGIGDELVEPIKQKQKVDEENIATNYSLINQNTAQIKENTTDIQSVEGVGQLTYVYITDQNGNRITDQIGRELVGQKWLVVTDKTLTQSDLPADAKAVGDAIAKSKQFDATKYGIPVLYLYGDRITSLKDKNGSLKNEVQYNFPKYHIKGTCTNFKVQGASSATLPKKNWTLNFN